MLFDFFTIDFFPSLLFYCWLFAVSTFSLLTFISFDFFTVDFFPFRPFTRRLLGLLTFDFWLSAPLLNPRPAGPLDFPSPAGGGGGAFERPPPMISAHGRCREKRKAAFESSRKIISKSFRSFFGSGQNWGFQGSKFQNFPKRFFDNKIFHFKDRATNLIPLCLSRQGASNHI